MGRDTYSGSGENTLPAPAHRHPEPRLARARFLQRSSRGEGPCASFEILKHKFPPAYSQAEDNACSFTALGMTIFEGYKSPKYKINLEASHFAFLRTSVSGVPDEPAVGSVGWLSPWWDFFGVQQ